MMISNQGQLLLLFRCLGCGAWLGILWEIISLVRRCFPMRKICLFLLDTVGTVISGLLLFVFSLAVNGGELRAVMLIAVGAGMLVVHTTIGKPLSWLFCKTKPLCEAVCAFWGSCLQKGALLCQKSRKKVVFFSKKGLQYVHRWVYNRNNK